MLAAPLAFGGITTHYVTAGGGYNLYGSQAVLEKNVELFSSIYKKRRSANDSASLFYGAGSNSNALDVIETDPRFTKEEKLFSTLFDSCNSPDCILRHNRLEGLSGPMTRAQVLRELDDTATRRMDAFRFYFTGHGSPGAKNIYTKNVMDTWRGEEISVQDFTKKLEQINPKVHVQVMMVQCFSGDFSQMIYQGGKIGAPITTTNRCGFFSQLPDRLASGCTPDVKIREEYSPYFFAAQSGVNEKGQSVDADFNHDGMVTSSEAHAYVIAVENAIDVPVSTSSEFLRNSKLVISSKTYQMSSDALLKKMRPEEKAIIRALEEKLSVKLAGKKSPIATIQAGIEKQNQMMKWTSLELQQEQRKLDLIWSEIRLDLEESYPIFRNAWGANFGTNRNPSQRLLDSAQSAFLKHPKYLAFQTQFELRDQLSAKISVAQKIKVKWERLAYLIFTKMYEEALLSHRDQKMKNVYQGLKDCENQPYFN